MQMVHVWFMHNIEKVYVFDTVSLGKINVLQNTTKCSCMYIIL